jgi:transposase
LLIEPVLASSDGLRGRPFRGHRQVIEVIMYRARAGSPWRKRHRRYSGDGTYDTILAALTTEADARELLEWTVSVDSTVNRAHQHATNLTRDTGGSVELHESLRRAG